MAGLVLLQAREEGLDVALEFPMDQREIVVPGSNSEAVFLKQREKWIFLSDLIRLSRNQERLATSYTSSFRSYRPFFEFLFAVLLNFGRFLWRRA